MASISSLTGSSSTSSIYGNRNVISGLASGMDTEAMIENSISGYKKKITSLQKQQVKTEWKQDAYRSIISKMVGLTQKYTSYTSATNLFSNSFFNRAVVTQANGKYADKVSATGKSSNDVKINSIEQLARAAKYTTGADALIQNASSAEVMDWTENVQESTVAGSISMVYGNNTLSVRFGEDDIFNNMQEMADAINNQLSEQTIKSSGGASKASEFLEAKVVNERLIIEQKAGKDNKFYVDSASENLEKVMGGAIGEDNSGRVVTFGGLRDDTLTKGVDMVEHLKDRSISFTLNGSTKSVSFDFLEDDETKARFKELDENKSLTKGQISYKKTEYLAGRLQKKVDEAFGEGKISVGIDKVLDADGKASGGKLNIQAVKDLEKDENGNETQKDLNNYTLTVNSSAGRALGLGKNGIGNTLNTSWTLGDVFGEENAMFKQTEEDGSVNYNGKKKLIINGKELGEFGKDTTIEHILTSINNNADAGVNVSFSKSTNEFVFSTREMGANQKIEFGGDLAKNLFGDPAAADSKYVKGEDARFTVNINGTEKTMTRSTNVVDLDGLNVTLKGEFTAENADDAITFTSTTDSDTIVDAIKSFVEDYNAMAKEIKGAYSTLPYQKSSGSFANYEPLVGDETDGYSDKELERYEEKAKQGILFGDSDLRSLYQSLTGYIQGSGVDGATLRSIGIETAYDDGMTTIKLNETKLREALTANPDKVRDAFAKTTENGASTNGLMQNLKTVMDRYASTSIATPGILVQKAGTPLSSYSLQSNQLQTQMDNLETQIEKWQDKMSDRIDYYTNQFTRLEQLINQMNSQSSALAGLMGG